MSAQRTIGVMLSRLRFLLLLPIASLIACGASSTPATSASVNALAGDYVITAGVGTGSAANFTGALTVSGLSASGVFRYAPINNCVSNSQDIAFTGSSSNSVLTLTSAAFSGSVATLTIQLPFSQNNIGANLANGTSVITGGTCALASTALQAQLVSSYSDTWLATLTSPSAATATLVVTESSTPDQDGQFPANGILTINASGCGAATPDNTFTGLVSGTGLQLKSGQTNVTISANNAGSPVSIAISGDINGSTLGSCATTYTGTMVVQ